MNESDGVLNAISDHSAVRNVRAAGHLPPGTVRSATQRSRS